MRPKIGGELGGRLLGNSSPRPTAVTAASSRMRSLGDRKPTASIRSPSRASPVAARTISPVASSSMNSSPPRRSVTEPVTFTLLFRTSWE